MKKNSKKQKKKVIIKQYQVYDSIEDLIVWNFKKAQSTNDLRYLLVLDNYKELPLKNYDASKLFKAWKKINDEFIDEFGFTEKQQLIYDKMLQLDFVRADKIIKKDKSLDNKIRMYKREIEDLLKDSNQEQQSFEKQVGILIVNLKIPIDTRKITVKEYYYLIELYEEQIKQHNETNKKLNKNKGRS